MEKTGPSLASRAFAAVILLVAAWVLLKVVVGFVTWLATVLAVIAAIVAVIWAVRVLA